ncbi:MAG: sugar ABC transporter permease, partial [Anaerolineales bacterium]|nr:sugar ABC transporter permease [Anaerolineales bacterium]
MSLSDALQPSKRRVAEWLTPRRLRKWRENLTGYLMIAPAVTLVFIFGIFPVGFALFVSLHKWRLKRGEIIGMVNYTNAVGSLAYLLVFALGVGLLAWALFKLRGIYKDFKGGSLRFWLLNLPGILLTSVGLSFINWTVVLLPNILDIADKIRGVDKTRELFMQLLHEAFTADAVLAARAVMFWLIFGAVATVAVAIYLWRTPETLQQAFELASNWFLIGVGAILLGYVYTQMMGAYDAAVQTGEDPGFLPQLVSITTGLILLFIGWKIWQQATDQPTTFLFFLRLVGAMVFIVGGWIMVGGLPVIVAAGDPDLWVGLKATLFYSLGTVPFQLGISIFLAVLLFQNLVGSNFFRMMFFIPYVTPTVASAAVFRQLFSNRLQAPVNAG